MKKAILILTLLPCIAFGQTTAIPDANFEQALIDEGLDDVIDGSVLTANISGVTYLTVGGNWLQSGNISDLTGIEDFSNLTNLSCDYNNLQNIDLSNNSALTHLNCSYNQLTSLDVSNNTALTYLSCGSNQLTFLDISNNTALTTLHCHENQLTSLDISNNTALDWLYCHENQLTSLDVSNNTALETLSCGSNQLTFLDISNNTALDAFWCDDNQLTSLDASNNTALTILGCDYNQLTCLNVKNGNNANFAHFNARPNSSLYCIEVDDSSYSTSNWFGINFKFDPQTSFSEDCNYPSNCFVVGIDEQPNIDKTLLNIYDLLGRPSLPVPNQILLYKYSDGSVEKRIQLDR